MTNVILYEFIQKDGYCMEDLVNSFSQIVPEDVQGVIVHEYDDKFLKATYWKKAIKREYRYILENQNFETIEHEIIEATDFGIEIEDKKLLVFGNKQAAQRIITLIGIVSKNSYIISDYMVDIEKLVKRICEKENVELLKMRLKDISLEKGVLVSCSINLATQDEPKQLALKYIKNIVVVSFRLSKVPANVSIYRNGKFSVSKISDEEKDEMVKKIIEIIY